MNRQQFADPARTGGNEPCFCGSGKKFKKCHRASFEPLRPGVQSPMREVPASIERPPYAETGDRSVRGESDVKTPEVIERMRRTGVAAAEILRTVGDAVAPGVTTDELDRICHDASIEAGGYPSPLNYGHFPASVCTSVNEVICHGIPDDRPLRDGDIVNLDVTLYREGVHGDTNATWCVGTVDPLSRQLVRVTRECLERAIDQVAPGRPFNAIGRVIQEHAERYGFSVVRAFIGHGVGETFHSDLAIMHYYDPHDTRVITEGMTFTIEPMIALGDWRHRMWADDWTAVTVDGRRTAQFEHSLLVTGDGVEILTLHPDGSWSGERGAADELGAGAAVG